MAITYEVLRNETDSFKTPKHFHKVLVTPDMASKFLSINYGNRPLKPASIAKYTKDMLNNEWQYNGDSIRFNKNGNMSNGQNRCHAIVKSGRPQTFNIETGIDVEAFETMDIGAKRSGSDIAALLGVRNPNIIASAIKTILTYDHSDDFSMKSASPSNHDITIFIKDGANHINVLEECSTLGSKYKKSLGGLSSSTFTAFLYLMRRKHNDKALEFFDLLSNVLTSNLPSDSPISVLFKRVFTISGEAKRLSSTERVALLVKAYAFWLSGRKAKTLSWSMSKEKFPKIP